MQKDFKIGLTIGTVLAAGAIIWLATLPNLSAQARAFQAASNINPSPKTPPIASSPATSPIPPDTEIPNTNGDTQRPVLHSFSDGGSAEPASDTKQSGEPASAIRATNNEQPTTNSELTQRIHVVQKGDTLSAISAKYYGSARQWRKIVAANRDNLPDPNHLTPGSKLLIPQ